MGGVEEPRTETPCITNNGTSIDDEPEASAPDMRDSPADIHKRLRKRIEIQKKKLKKKKVLASDTSVAHTLIDLEALSQYNDLRLTLSNKKNDIKKSLPTLPSRLRNCVQTRWALIKPAADASKSIASRCGKGPFYVRTLHKMAHTLSTTGELPENQQGQGAHHDTLLAMPAISSAIQQWVKGVLPFEKGGFNRWVSAIFQVSKHSLNLCHRCIPQSFVDMSMSSYFLTSRFKIQSASQWPFDG